jgi:hypothetical protein
VVAIRSILVGWAALLSIVYLLERPLLFWTAPILGSAWFATARLTLDCLCFAATGWIIGRFNRGRFNRSQLSNAGTLFGVLAFAATLTVRDFDPLLAINVPWLVHLIANTFLDRRYAESLFVTAASHAFLFGSLFAGSRLARPSRTEPVSIFRDAKP